MSDYAVIGLGQFGGSLCRELSEEGMNVLAIDIDEERVNEFKNIVSHAVIADATDEETLKELGIQNIDHVIVAIGDNIQASILTTAILTDFNIQKITVKANNAHQEKILNKIGAHQIVHPERDMGKRIARHFISNNILDYIQLSDKYSVYEVKAGEKMVGKSLMDLDIRAKYECNVIAIKRGEHINITPNAADGLEEDDVLIMIGSERDFKRFEKHMVIN